MGAESAKEDPMGPTIEKTGESRIDNVTCGEPSVLKNTINAEDIPAIIIETDGTSPDCDDKLLGGEESKASNDKNTSNEKGENFYTGSVEPSKDCLVKLHRMRNKGTPENKDVLQTTKVRLTETSIPNEENKCNQ